MAYYSDLGPWGTVALRTKNLACALFGLGFLFAIENLAAFPQKVDPPSAVELNAITERGILLNEYDQAAWHASDAVETANPKTTEGQRCIAKKENGKWNVVFGKLNEDKSLFQIYFEAAQREKPQEFAVSAETVPRADSGFYLFAARAIYAALEDFQGEKRPYNVAVLPAPQDRLFVYVYPAQTKPRIYPLGGDVRYLFSADGTKILEKRQMHKTILEASRMPGKKTVAGVHKHVVSDMPEDTDVLHVLTQDPRQPEFVATPHFFFEVHADGSITIEKEMKRK
jgi:hypothetical protein